MSLCSDCILITAGFNQGISSTAYGGVKPRVSLDMESAFLQETAVEKSGCTSCCTSQEEALSPSTDTSKATASTVIAKGNLRQGRMMAEHDGLYSTTTGRLRQIGAKDG